MKVQTIQAIVLCDFLFILSREFLHSPSYSFTITLVWISQIISIGSYQKITPKLRILVLYYSISIFKITLKVYLLFSYFAGIHKTDSHSNYLLNYSMGYDVFLMAKTRDEEKEYRMHLCEEKKRIGLSEQFTFFLSAEPEDSGLEEVECIFNIDLSAFKRHPANFEPDTSDLEYRLYLAEKEEDIAKMREIQTAIEQVNSDWDKNYDTDHRGWNAISDMRKVIQTLLQKIEQQPDFGKQMKDADGWGNYFSTKPSEHRYGEQARFINDLHKLLVNLDCMEAEGIEYVGFVGLG